MPLFIVKGTDSYGTNNDVELRDDDKPLKLEDQTLVVVWNDSVAENYYDDLAEKVSLF